MSYVILSTAEVNAFGNNSAMKKQASYRMDIIDDNAKSYSKWLNAPERMRKL